jgi:hypothetical protein
VQSLRLNDDLRREMRDAAAISGEGVSQFIRTAIQERCDRVKTKNAAKAFSEIVGMISSSRKRVAPRNPTSKDAALLLADSHLESRKRKKAG